MRKIIHTMRLSFMCAVLFAVGLLAPGCTTNTPAQPGEDQQGSASVPTWEARAEAAQAAFVERYWNDAASLFNNADPCDDCDDPFHYWWQAHALDVLIDGYERTGDPSYLARAEALYDGIVDRNGGITNDYYDDMLWMALAVLRLYEHTEDPTYRRAVHRLWEDIQTGWNDAFGGGIAWRKSQLDYKNTPANAPAVILAARLYQQFGDEDDLDWARRIYQWLQNTLVDPETGFAWDGINRTGEGDIDKQWEFTYNQGVYLGASLELYRSTGDEAYLDEAARTAEAAAKRLTEEDGLLQSEGTGDGGLFKGIFVRYLGQLIRHAPQAHTAHRELLARNAEALWSQAESQDDLLFAPSWTDTADRPVDLSVQLSGLMLLEQMARLTAGT